MSSHHFTPTPHEDTIPQPAVRATKLEAFAPPAIPVLRSQTSTAAWSSPNNLGPRPMTATRTYWAPSPSTADIPTPVNDMTIEIDADNSSADASRSPKPTRDRNVILVHDMEVDVDADGEESSESAPPGVPFLMTSLEPTPTSKRVPKSIPHPSSPSTIASLPPALQLFARPNMHPFERQHDRISSPTSHS